MGKETFQYQASREPRKWAKCLSENDAFLTSQPLLGSEREQCLALGFQPSWKSPREIEVGAQAGPNS